ncbi:translational activator of GCN4, partial [Elasticomyces elasticus]
MDDFPWQEVKSGDLERLQVLLSSSSTARRGRALQDLRDRAGSELPQESHTDLLELLLRTYPLYVDRPSRHAVQQCVRALLKTPAAADDVKYLAGRLRTEASKRGLSATSAFVLVEWCSVLLQHLRDESSSSLETVLDVIAVDAKALDTCLAAAPKPTVEQSALRVTRRALRTVFSSETW